MEAQQKCPACQQLLPVGTAAGRFCPACGVDLIQASGQPGWVVQGVDLRVVARLQRQLVWYVVVLAVMELMPIAAQGDLMLSLILLPVRLVVTILIIVGTVRMLAALRASMFARVAYAVLLLMPCLGVLLLLAANSRATRTLRSAGLKVGLTGVKDDDVERVLGPYRCRRCGYSLIGNTSGRCPECGAPAQPIPASSVAVARPVTPPTGRET